MEKPLSHRRIKLSAQNGRLVVLQLSVMLNAGVPILQALEALTKTEETPVREFGFRVLQSVSVGHTLNQSFAKSTDFFSESEISLLRTGEETGKLALLLTRLSEQLEKEQSLRRQISSALTYPLGILVLTGLMALFMANFMLPELLSATENALRNPPLPTRVLSYLAQQGGVVSTLCLVILCSIPWLYSSVPQAQSLRHWLLYQSPVLGRLSGNLELSRLSRQLSLMLHTGLTIRKALSSLESSSQAISDGIHRVLQSLSTGATITESFAEAGPFQPDYLAMIEVGEETGRLAIALERQADYLEVNAQRDLQDLVKLVEPLAMIILGCLVAFVMLGCFLPVYQVAAQTLQ